MSAKKTKKVKTTPSSVCRVNKKCKLYRNEQLSSAVNEPQSESDRTSE